MENTLSTPWDFVEKYYPDYHSSTKIQEANYLIQIMEGDI
jgi:hypothetical protein